MGVLFLVGGLVAIIIGANALVNGASSIAKYFKISDLVIGLTIVSIGTSAPEFAINIISALKGNTDIAVGNILGSNIANILLILGVSAIVYPLTIHRNTQFKEIPLAILAIIVIGICGNDIIIDNGVENVLSRIDGLIMICFFLIFLYYTFQIATNDDVLTEKIAQRSLWKSTLLLLLGMVFLFAGGKYFVEGAVVIARFYGMSETAIGLTIVAIGTSLPELATSVVAAYKKQVDIAVGNVVGSNIFNVFLILGTTSTIKSLPINPSINFDIAFALFASILLFVVTFLFNKRKISRIEGIIFAVLYIFYIAYSLVRQ